MCGGIRVTTFACLLLVLGSAPNFLAQGKRTATESRKEYKEEKEEKEEIDARLKSALEEVRTASGTGGCSASGRAAS
jgi:hypothetical protein